MLSLLLADGADEIYFRGLRGGAFFAVQLFGQQPAGNAV